jgi:hypothetical protein
MTTHSRPIVRASEKPGAQIRRRLLTPGLIRPALQQMAT